VTQRSVQLVMNDKVEESPGEINDDAVEIAHSEKTCRTFIRAKQVDRQLSNEIDRKVRCHQSKSSTLRHTFNVVCFSARLSLSFRCHDETDQSLKYVCSDSLTRSTTCDFHR